MTGPDSEPAAEPSPPLAGSELQAWRGFLQVHAMVTRRLDAEMQAEHGLSVSAYEVLLLLGEAPGGRLRMAEIASRVLLTRSGCTRLVDRLTRQGFVTRATTADDGRGLYAQLTAAGASALEAARITHHRGVREHFLAAVDPGELDRLAGIWGRALSPGASPRG